MISKKRIKYLVYVDKTSIIYMKQVGKQLKLNRYLHTINNATFNQPNEH